MHLAKKIVGTVVPLASLHSKRFPQYGMFETGELFLDWLGETGQSAWQLLPLHETQLERGSKTRHVSSPYKGYGIGLDPTYLSDLAKKRRPNNAQLQIFQQENAYWLTDYALFCALRDRFETDDWTSWDEPIRTRNALAIEKAKKDLAARIRNHTVEQWQTHYAYASLRNKAKQKEIFLIGDLPYYLGLKSPLVWTHQALFQLTKDWTMLRVSGILGGPKAYFGRQLWGHPLYQWGSQSQNKNIITFWKIRLRYLAKLFDVVRLDHATGFFSYGSLDPNNSSHDTVESGPGFPVFKELAAYLQTVGLGVFAEGTLAIKDSPKETIAKLDIWGIRIFRYGLNEKINEVVNKYAHIESYPPNTVAYTTTHDTQPLMGYLALLTLSQKKLLAKYAHVPFINNDKRLVMLIRQAIIDSKSKIVIIPIQDWLLTEDRINTPGTENETNNPNWRYRLSIPVERLPLVTY